MRKCYEKTIHILREKIFLPKGLRWLFHFFKNLLTIKIFTSFCFSVKPPSSTLPTSNLPSRLPATSSSGVASGSKLKLLASGATGKSVQPSAVSSNKLGKTSNE